MANTYTWKIKQLDCKPSLNGQSNVIYTAHWELTASNETHQATIVGIHSIPYNDNGNYIPYEQVTESQVIEWIKDLMGDTIVALMESNASKQLETSEESASITHSLPWTA
jgi:hypothetical protein